MFVALPVLMALSWVPVTHTAAEKPAPAPAPQKSEPLARATDTITCPVTGEEIPSCCCPVKK